MTAAPSMTAALVQGDRGAIPSVAGAEAATARSHLYAVDVVRLLTVAGVIAVHATSLTVGSTARGALAAGVVLVLLHVTREVFIFLTAFVLGFRYRADSVEKRAFWKRRYLVVVVPYVVWSLIYVLADGHLTSPGTVLARYAEDLATGGARFHLYFLLITFQIYAVFPWVIRWVRRVRPAPLLAASLALQLAFTAGTHYWTSAPGPLGAIFDYPGSWLWSYQFYLIAGLLAAVHFDAVTDWVGHHRRLIVAGSLGVAAAVLASYAVDLTVLGMAPVKASEVFQPAVVLGSIAAIAGQYALGLWVNERLEARRASARTARRRVRLASASDVSFGVFLSHPLLLQAVLAVAGATGLSVALGGLPVVAQLALVLGVLVPGVYLIAAALIGVARRTPLSLALAGRRGPVPWRRREHVPPPSADRPGLGPALSPAL